MINHETSFKFFETFNNRSLIRVVFIFICKNFGIKLSHKVNYF